MILGWKLVQLVTVDGDYLQHWRTLSVPPIFSIVFTPRGFPEGKDVRHAPGTAYKYPLLMVGYTAKSFGCRTAGLAQAAVTSHHICI
ncbi:hypothetical protein M404DRAFT_1001340 [Pisolithus tinctorius Marx 270]|uniref:Uncharacterized protein n=1 Tax=Pisolithus tinctorius Marx 270 TaxID=870435 RepID=A0A0C3K1L2_PISTI|nr:hypothetical protein M404DRAFT_1001340 [Pisolithus tinctorius Marx 270]